MKHIDLLKNTTPNYVTEQTPWVNLLAMFILNAVEGSVAKLYNDFVRNTLLIINIIVSIAITVLILIQGRGGGLGGAWGGGGETFHTRRGIDKITLRLTIVLIVIFFLVSAYNLLVRT